MTFFANPNETLRYLTEPKLSVLSSISKSMGFLGRVGGMPERSEKTTRKREKWRGYETRETLQIVHIQTPKGEKVVIWQ